MIRQGDVFWVALEDPRGSATGYLHPHVVLQNDLFNDSALRTCVVCVLSSNLRRADLPGNVLLDEGEAGLPRRSVVIVSQIFTVDKEDLVEKIGSLSEIRVREILSGVQLTLEPTVDHEG
ncbi:MAG TPA: type II toxin-antitoxin system PemK/MazF family toxin [Thermoanaerobaculia bacterium]|nr:type II toxin-antitoxin system PemK/MazF family toxin [Thermoanaerobaculia bacterium]